MPQMYRQFFRINSQIPEHVKNVCIGFRKSFSFCMSKKDIDPVTSKKREN